MRLVPTRLFRVCEPRDGSRQALLDRDPRSKAARMLELRAVTPQATHLTRFGPQALIVKRYGRRDSHNAAKQVHQIGDGDFVIRTDVEDLSKAAIESSDGHQSLARIVDVRKVSAGRHIA